MVGGELVLRQPLGPKPGAGKADIPVGKIVHEPGKLGASSHDIVCIQRFRDLGDGGGEAGKQPAIQGRPGLWGGMRFRVEAVDPGVQGEEVVRVPHRVQKAEPGLGHTLGVDPAHRPGGRVGDEVPAHGIGSVLIGDRQGIEHVAPGFAHLLALGIQAHAGDEHVPIRGLPVHQHPGDEQRIEPASGLVQRLADEVRRVRGAEQLFVLKGVVPLGGVHGPGVEPGIQHLGNPVHGAPTLAAQLHLIYIRAVQLHPTGQLGIQGMLHQLLSGADHPHGPAACAHPNGEWGPPEPVPGQGPVAHGAEEIPEPSPAHVFGVPVHLLAFGDDLVLPRGGGDEPGIDGVIKKGGITAPAERVIVGIEPG